MTLEGSAGPASLLLAVNTHGALHWELVRVGERGEVQRELSDKVILLY
jgi:hypothetical protein